MPDKITYYAVIGGARTIEDPYGLVRRQHFRNKWGPFGQSVD